jgi:hypothetical protein
VSQGQTQGQNQHALMESMFDQVMQRYALLAKQITSGDTQKINLNIYDLENSEQLQVLEAQLAANQAMFNSVELLSIQAGLVQYVVNYQGSYQNVVTWLRAWQVTDFVGDSKNLHQVDVKFNPKFYAQEILDKLTAEKNQQGVQ